MIEKVKVVLLVFVYVKLFFNVIDIVVMVKVVEIGGVDGFIMINILVGIVFDRKIGKLIIVNIIGGLLGFVIRFVVIRMVY